MHTSLPPPSSSPSTALHKLYQRWCMHLLNQISQRALRSFVHSFIPHLIYTQMAPRNTSTNRAVVSTSGPTPIPSLCDCAVWRVWIEMCARRPPEGGYSWEPQFESEFERLFFVFLLLLLLSFLGLFTRFFVVLRGRNVGVSWKYWIRGKDFNVGWCSMMGFFFFGLL